MSDTRTAQILRERLRALVQVETRRYVDTHPASARAAHERQANWMFGVPMHWMRDWPGPFPLTVEAAVGSRVRCVDGHSYLDFCLGDSGAMFGHSPAAVADALAAQASQGLTAMLPGALLSDVGTLLESTFGLPRWQLALSATDANRFAIRWARAVTGRDKVLVFDGCYHGTVDDTLVDMAPDGRTLTRASLLGQVHDLSRGTVIAPFNDLDAVAALLTRGDVAAVLTEPALTNCGLVPPAAGFLESLQAQCRAHDAVFILDETHTLSTGHGGYAQVHGLQPDMLVVGKAIAGGFPTAVYGCTATMAARIEAAKAAAPEGHSGIGTTLSANLLSLVALRAALQRLATPAHHRLMNALAADLQSRLETSIARARLPWTVTRLGARLEIQHAAHTPVCAAEARNAADGELETALHLFMVNRHVLLTPFHNMLLMAPSTSGADIERVGDLFDDFIDALIH